MTNVPIPKAVNYPVPGLVGSLETETLHWKSQTKGGHISLSSVGCQGSKRPYSIVFTTALPGQANETSTVSGSAPCSK